MEIDPLLSFNKLQVKDTYMIPLFNSWKEITIRKYFEIQDIISSDSDEVTKNVNLVSLLYGISADEVWNKQMDEIDDMTSRLSWVSDFELTDVKSDKMVESVNLPSFKCTVHTDLNKFTLSQYVDFQHWWSMDKDKHIAEILGCFLVPDGMRYNEGYDVQALIGEINDSMPIMIAQNIYFFFVNSYLNSIKDIKESLRVVKKRRNRTLLRGLLKRLNQCRMVLSGSSHG